MMGKYYGEVMESIFLFSGTQNNDGASILVPKEVYKIPFQNTVINFYLPHSFLRRSVFGQSILAPCLTLCTQEEMRVLKWPLPLGKL